MARAPKPQTTGGAFTELGETSLKQWGGIIREEFLRQLTGSRAAKTYREMADNDAVVGAMLFAMERLTHQVEWKVGAGDETPESEEAAEFVDGCLRDMSQSWEETLSEILSFLTYGWSYHEIIYKRRVGPQEKNPMRRSRFDDGRIGWRKLPVRGQESLLRWEFDQDGGIRGLWQMPITSGRTIFIPIEKALLFRTTSRKNNPEGRAVLRTAYRAWYHKKRLEEIESIGIERDLAGLPVARCPSAIMSSDAPAADQTKYGVIKTLVKNIRNDEQSGVVLPSDRDPASNEYIYDFDLVSTAGQRAVDTGAVIERYSRHIAMAVLADFILLGHEKVGSFALSESKTDLFAVAMGSFLDHIAAVFNQHAIPRLLALNGMNGTASLTHGDIESQDAQKLFEALSKGALAGFDFTDLEDTFRERLGWPVRVMDEADGADPDAQPGEEDDEPRQPARQRAEGNPGEETPGKPNGSAQAG